MEVASHSNLRFAPSGEANFKPQSPLQPLAQPVREPARRHRGTGRVVSWAPHHGPETGEENTADPGPSSHRPGRH
ncbi:hypothetical protein GGTG_03371 [Gaeumannomyces tritici R3-111a-1]|uniref:Uncharacterized protein n=1 Tax=Gaeumannomyces tritici (strain R3-111a-1) TaxID=644352 RepID=J3NQ13_GAET3|nr:hypothetical protein GGTG_03371 [Gaeumannomyces tritici R3-111a-1]EJT78269.1 hypothetical protein GGTG_03371 [Gaeumannomyces tritici R3-111a-1]